MLKAKLHKEGCKNTKDYVCIALGTEGTTWWEIKRGAKPYSPSFIAFVRQSGISIALPKIMIADF
jgi:hypothetical protein